MTDITEVTKQTRDYLKAKATKSSRLRPSLISLVIAPMLGTTLHAQAAIINVQGQQAGQCTLRAAISSANSDSAQGNCSAGFGDDIINLPANSTFSYSNGLTATSYGEYNALPTVSSAITINGNNSTITRAVGALGFRIIEVSNAPRVVVNNVTVSGGTSSEGGGIRATNSDLTLNNAQVQNNSASADGGGIFVLNGTLQLNDSSVSGNVSIDGAGLFLNGGSTSFVNSEIDINVAVHPSINDSGRGGGVYARNATLVMNGVTVNRNSATNTDGSRGIGGGWYLTNSSVAAVDTTLSSNTSAQSAGAIRMNDESDVSLYGGEISSNTSLYGGAIAMFSGSTIKLNQSSVSMNIGANGGAFFISEASTRATIKNSTLNDNTATSSGGAIDLRVNASLIVENSNFVENEAARAAAIYLSNSSNATIGESSFVKNEVISIGAAIRVNASSLTINNSTLHQNVAEFDGGAIDIVNSSSVGINNSTLSSNSAGRNGGAISHKAGSLTVTNSTLSLNSAAVSGGGLFRASGSVPSLSNTVIANSSGGDCGGDAVLLNTANNWFEDGIDCLAPAQGDPRLGKLADNGGPSLTHAPQAGSPLAGAGNPSICNSAPVNGRDQRGEQRGTESCFIGAVEGVESSTFFVIPTQNGKVVVIEL